MSDLDILRCASAAMFFFALRRRRPFAYGGVEFVIGLIGLTLTFYPQAGYLLTEDSSASGLILSRGIAIVGGIYLLVRGMDNMERGLPDSRRPFWQTFFPISR